jgi:GNAT superfamily N-acetyltransferase
MAHRLRNAAESDRATLEALIAQSARELSAADYTPEQIDAALRGAFGVDSQLIRDGTYYVVQSEEDAIVGCGGWSRRRTLFGGDAHAERDAAELDPQVDAAKIRAFFVHPGHARRGIGRLILEHCEMQARAAGFTRFELMATLPGTRLYATHGYKAETPISHDLGDGLTIQFVPMRKTG